MDFTLTIEHVQERVFSDDTGKWDTLLPREELSLYAGKLHLPEARLQDNPPRTTPVPAVLTPSAWALTQMCQRLGIPAAYFKRCPSSLQDPHFNYWCEHVDDGKGTGHRRAAQEKWLLRVRNDTLRGVLSNRYSPLDNGPLLQCLDPLLEARFQVGWFALTEESLHLRLVDPRLARDVLPDDRLMVGIHIANSEVGKRAVTVDAMVFRCICTNGLIRLVKGQSLLHQRHLFLSRPHFETALREAIGEALAIAAGFLEQLAWATHAPVRDIEKTLKALSSQWNLSKTFAEQVKVALLTERPSQQETVYGLVNALTNAAQRLPVDDRYHLEVLAGQLLEHRLGRDGHRSVDRDLEDDPLSRTLELVA